MWTIHLVRPGLWCASSRQRPGFCWLVATRLYSFFLFFIARYIPNQSISDIKQSHPIRYPTNFIQMFLSSMSLPCAIGNRHHLEQTPRSESEERRRNNEEKSVMQKLIKSQQMKRKWNLVEVGWRWNILKHVEAWGLSFLPSESDFSSRVFKGRPGCPRAWPTRHRCEGIQWVHWEQRPPKIWDSNCVCFQIPTVSNSEKTWETYGKLNRHTREESEGVLNHLPLQVDPSRHDPCQVNLVLSSSTLSSFTLQFTP